MRALAASLLLAAALPCQGDWLKWEAPRSRTAAEIEALAVERGVTPEQVAAALAADPVTSYRVQQILPAPLLPLTIAEVPAPLTQIPMPALPPGIYRFTVTAFSAGGGEGTPSDILTTAVPVIPPAAPPMPDLPGAMIFTILAAPDLLHWSPIAVIAVPYVTGARMFYKADITP